MSKSLLFNSGIPTEPDVKHLLERFAPLEPGNKISYEQIERIVSVDRKSNRFRSILQAWRKTLERDRNVILRAIPNEGFEVMDSESRILHCATTYKHSLRRIGRTAVRAERTEPAKLTHESARVRDHLIRVASSIRLAAATTAKAIKEESQ